jgi:hypothetical protein
VTRTTPNLPATSSRAWGASNVKGVLSEALALSRRSTHLSPHLYPCRMSPCRRLALPVPSASVLFLAASDPGSPALVSGICFADGAVDIPFVSGEDGVSAAWAVRVARKRLAVTVIISLLTSLSPVRYASAAWVREERNAPLPQLSPVIESSHSCEVGERLPRLRSGQKSSRYSALLAPCLPAPGTRLPPG